jgi:hypothetical protein
MPSARPRRRSLNSAYLLVEEAGPGGIRTLYESEAFPPRQPRPAPADNDAAA